MQDSTGRDGDIEKKNYFSISKSMFFRFLKERTLGNLVNFIKIWFLLVFVFCGWTLFPLFSRSLCLIFRQTSSSWCTCLFSIYINLIGQYLIWFVRRIKSGSGKCYTVQGNESAIEFHTYSSSAHFPPIARVLTIVQTGNSRCMKVAGDIVV